MSLTKYNSLYEPTNLDLDNRLSAADYDKFADRIRFVTHFLIMDRIFRKKNKVAESRWVSIHSSVLRSALGERTYKETLNLAVNLGIIEVDNVYLPASQSDDGKGLTKRYRLQTPYSAARWQRVRVSCRQVLNYLERRRNYARHKSNWLPVHHHLWKWVQKVTVEGEPPTRLGENTRLTFDMIRKRDYWSATRCRYGRFHTILTTCKKELRDAWRINGEPLVELDIRNCQPLLLAWFVYFVAGKELIINKQIKYLTKNSNQSNSNNLMYTPYVLQSDTLKLPNPLPPRDLRPEDAFLMLNHCENACFYDVFFEKAFPGCQLTDTQYQSSKQQILTEFYDDWEQRRTRKMIFVDVLEQSFPTAFRVCEKVKASGFEELARLMQRLESFVIIENVCQRLMDQHPAIPIITVHDALFTTEQHVPRVRDVIRETFLDVLGVNVAFKNDTPCPFANVQIDSSLIFALPSASAGMP